MTAMALALIKAGFPAPETEEVEFSPSYCVVCLSDCLWPSKYCSLGCQLMDELGYFEPELNKAYGCIIVPRRKEH